MCSDILRAAGFQGAANFQGNMVCTLFIYYICTHCNKYKTSSIDTGFQCCMSTEAHSCDISRATFPVCTAVFGQSIC